jgi:DNA-binding MarR family transcriptional regulator
MAPMARRPAETPEIRAFRNSALYRSLTRTLRAYNRRLVARLHTRGFPDFAPSFPSMLSNLDFSGTRIGVLAARAGVTRQGAGQLLREIERCGYVERRDSPHDARATVIRFTPRGRRLMATIFALVEEMDAELAGHLDDGAFAQIRDGLRSIADRIDSSGAFGANDEPQTPSKRRP